MSELTKNVGRFTLGTWLDGYPRFTSIAFGDHVIKSVLPEDLRDLRYAIDRFLTLIDNYDAKGTKG